MPYLTKEKKASFFTDFGGATTNTGSIEGRCIADRADQLDLSTPATQ